MITEKDINNALDRLIEFTKDLKNIKDPLALYNALKDLELKVAILKDMIAEILMREASR